jgi:predicted O-methyltransferase YrrM
MLPKNYESIHGWCTPEKALTLINLVYQSKPNLSVELGVFGGKSLLPIAIASKQINLNSKVIGIDAWEAEASLEGTNDKVNDDWWSKINYDEMYEYTKNLMIQNNVDSIVELWKTRSIAVYDKFEENSIDILHQDSNHSEEISCKEVELYSNRVKIGGFWIFDDTDWKTTQKAQNLLMSKGYEEYYVESQNKWKVFKRMY